jgi:hypothetical protein
VIPGLTTNAVHALSRLPSSLGHSTPNPFGGLLRGGLKDAIYLLVGRPVDPRSGQERLVTLATGSFGTGSSETTLSDGTVIPAHRLFRSRLKSPYNVSLNAFSEGRLSQSTALAGGAVSINLAYGDMDEIGRYIWEGTKQMVLVGQKGAPLKSFTPIFRGTCARPTRNHEAMSLPVKDPAEFLRRVLQTNLYKGYGNCVRLKAVNGYLVSVDQIGTTSEVTFEFRIRCSSTAPPVAAQILAALGSAWTAAGLDFYLQLTTSGFLQLIAHRGAGAGSGSVSHNVDLRDDKWHPVALSIKPGAGGVKLYVDGVLVGSATAPAYTPIAAAKLWIGSQMGVSNFAKVAVNDVRLWSVVRSAAEISANKDLFLHGVGDGLRLEWMLQEGNTTTAQDSSPNNRDGALVGGASWIGSGEGGEELRGKPKPLWFGWREQRAVVWVDGLNTSNVFQAHDGWMKGITKAYDKGNGATLVYDGDVATWDALYDATVAPGHWISCHKLGFGRTGAKPDGVLTLDGEGDKTGGVYVSSLAGIFRRVGERAGMASQDFDLEALALAESINSKPMGFSTGLEPIQVDEAFNQITWPISTWFYNRLEQVVLWVPTEPGEPVARITDRDVKLNRVTSLDVPPPPSSINVGYRPYEVVQTSDLSTSLTQTQKTDLGQPYRLQVREGEIVLGRKVTDRYKLAVPMDLMTSFRYEADAVAEGDRWLKLLQDNEMWEIPLIEGLFQYRIGETLEFHLSRHLTGGVRLVVVGHVENVDGNDIRLIVWGPRSIETFRELSISAGRFLLLSVGGSRLRLG